MVRFYIMPMAGTGTEEDPRMPKYLPAESWGAIDYGHEPVCLVRGVVTAEEHTTISSMPDVTTVPSNLDSTIGANLSAAKSELLSFDIPSFWMTSGMTWGQALKIVAVIFQLSQRFNGQNAGARILQGITLNTTFSSLSVNARQKLTNMSDSFGFDRSGITGSMTIEQILYELATQWAGSINLNGESL